MAATPQEIEEDTTFAELLDQYLPERLQRGQLIQGQVLRVTREGIIMDIGAKRDAIVPKQEVNKLSEEFIAKLTQGATAPVVVTHTPNGNEELEVSLRRGMEEMEWQQAEDLLRTGEIVERQIIGLNKGGVLVEFGTLTGFVPNSHLPALQYVNDPNTIQRTKEEAMGDTIPLKVIEINHQRRRLVLSAKEAEQMLRQERMQDLTVGSIVTGRVENIKDFGVFVNLGGVTGLIHVTKLDWFRVDHPSELLRIGDEVQAVVEAVDPDRGRIRLNRQAALPDPWQVLPTKHNMGEIIEGTVTNVTEFGVFVHLPLGIEGLVHSSELHPSEGGFRVLELGDKVLARIINMAPEQKRLGLSLRQVSPEDEAEWRAKQP
ncbi:MAG: S1 RNA-binding domain-containing protein [Caldilineaceae bacterium]|nr:S1 RNA-binding domain-containing protein [Caldilineaceae bacterium]